MEQAFFSQIEIDISGLGGRMKMIRPARKDTEAENDHLRMRISGLDLIGISPPNRHAVGKENTGKRAWFMFYGYGGEMA